MILKEAVRDGKECGDGRADRKRFGNDAALELVGFAEVARYGGDQKRDRQERHQRDRVTQHALQIEPIQGPRGGERMTTYAAMLTESASCSGVWRSWLDSGSWSE